MGNTGRTRVPGQQRGDAYAVSASMVGPHN
ncbi:hypothetical protein H4W81_006404 [Nonomuraea africana]|uniref:Uncharacterized protein n=1 Tax=Nonomuraea africana TaxID=46171 RepID=A0ABR9KPC5_9ACTN|nr:hypothetical protein [Nonomuraea africana]